MSSSDDDAASPSPSASSSAAATFMEKASPSEIVSEAEPDSAGYKSAAASADESAERVRFVRPRSDFVRRTNILRKQNRRAAEVAFFRLLWIPMIAYAARSCALALAVVPPIVALAGFPQLVILGR